MGLSMTNALAVLLVCLAAVNAVPVHFPHGKTITYKYYADVKAGTEQPVPFASQFAIDALLQVRHDTSDPTLKNAYYVTLADVKYGLHNGQAVHHEHVETLHPIGDQAKMIQDPFLIVYDENGKFQGVKLLENESGWSKNIKQAIASMLQLDLVNIQVQTPVKPHSFMTHENTIHGTCYVSYTVQPKPTENNVFVVTKIHEPKNCTHFVQRVFNHVETEGCHVESEDAMTTDSRRVVEIENQGDEILIRKFVGQGTINYMPWNANSEAHYLLTNQTLVLNDVTPMTFLPPVNFQGVPIVRDVTFNKPQGNYALHADEDLTQGRHIVKLDVLIPKLKKMLGEAADYLEENHIEMKEPDWKHGQTINRLLHTMRYMDLGSLEQVFNVIQDVKTPREVTIKNIFLEMIPHVGTTATCHFTLNVIRKHKVTSTMAVSILSKLPMHVKVPTLRLLMEMEDLIKLSESHPIDVRKAGILCFATLIHKTFVHDKGETVSVHLDTYLQHFLARLKNEPSYQMKVVYLMAIKNVKVGNIHKLLEPIIRGDLLISEYPHHIRVQAIWAIKECIKDNVEYAHDLLLPILSDTTLPLPLRIVAYDVLIHQLPHMGRAMNIHWLMVNEKNEHLVNYHITTIKSLANSVDPCLQPVREMAKKMSILIAKRLPLRGPLSSHNRVETYDTTYGYGEAFKTALVLDELTGMPHVGYIEHTTVTGRKIVPQFAIHWNAEGLNEVIKVLQQELLGETIEAVTNEKIKNVLIQAAKHMPPKKDIHLDLFLTMQGSVVLTAHYDKNNWRKIVDEIKNWRHIITNSKINWQRISYDEYFEMQVPTDLGLPTVLTTKVPRLVSLRMNTNLAEVKVPINLKIEADARVWRHGEYVMSIYNPIADVWHSVRRVTAQDIAMPVVVNIGYNHEAKSLKVTLPRLPLTKLSVGGMLTHAKNMVTVTEDETDDLKKSCATCHHHEVVTMGTVHKKYDQQVLDSKDTGLQYALSIFDCETQVTPVTRFTEWLNALSVEHQNTMNNVYIQWILGIRQLVTNQRISPKVGSCGHLVKIEPSILYPTSHIDINVRSNIEDLEHVHKSLHTLPSKKINLRGTVDVQAASLNTSIRSWDMNVNIDMSQGHVNNNMKVQITRVTPGEKDLKVCMEYQIKYPVNEGDILKPTNTKDEVNVKVLVSMGLADDDKCVRDTVVALMIESAMSEEQKKQVTHDNVHGICAREAQRFQIQQGQVPKTWNCIRETVLHSTLRKLSVNVAYKNVPHTMMTNVNMMNDFVRAIFLPHVKYTVNHVEPGTVKMVFEYPIDTDDVDVSVLTPVAGYEYVELPLGDRIWNVLMYNTRFSIPFLQAYKTETDKMCTVYPQVLINADNGTMPFAMTDHWVLLSGDYVDHTYAVFVKQVQGNKMAARIQVGDHELTITPTETKTIVTVNGNVVENHTKGVVVPTDDPNFAMKLTNNFEHLIVQSERVPVKVMCTPNSVTLTLDTSLQGKITGLCGHLDNTHTHTLPKIYNIAHL